jgi:toxin YoeB
MKVLWTKTAVKQRQGIFEYWNNRNKNNHYSNKLQAEIQHWTDQLKINPGLGRATNFNNVRTISMGHYSILYKKLNHKIIIVAFWDNRQDPKKLLRSLKGS